MLKKLLFCFFSFVPPGEDTEGVRAKYQVSNEQDALLVFNEFTERPVASVSMADIPVPTLHDVINNNNYLLLPRLSSQVRLLDYLYRIIQMFILHNL